MRIPRPQSKYGSQGLHAGRRATKAYDKKEEPLLKTERTECFLEKQEKHFMISSGIFLSVIIFVSEYYIQIY